MCVTPLLMLNLIVIYKERIATHTVIFIFPLLLTLQIFKASPNLSTNPHLMIP